MRILAIALMILLPASVLSAQEARTTEGSRLENLVPDLPPELRLEQIRKYIRDNGLEWEAGLTSKALLPVEAKRRILGNLIVPGDGAPTIQIVPGSVPDELDWRDFGGVSAVTPVKDQGSCGSCWAFAAAGTAESSFKFIYGTELDLSEQHLVSNGRICCTNCGDCQGGWSDSCFTFMINGGILDEAAMPYTGISDECRYSRDWEEHVIYPIESYFKIEPDFPEVYMHALFEYGPLAVGIFADDLFLFYSEGVYSNPAPTGELNHVVVLVGWDEEGWIIKNSWGTDWGEAGYGHIAFGS
ncbi:MAG: C1 family peptidase, partial [Bacteroidales bacterium]|nr:C1 family peptidase [Candidatus Latescibacterota bacterium]